MFCLKHGIPSTIISDKAKCTCMIENYHNSIEVCETCNDEFEPIDKLNYHCQKCQPCKPLKL